MKNTRIKILLSILLLSVINIFGLQKATAQVQAQVSFDLFYNELSPYGYWDNDNNYGDIWYPHVDNSFSPYNTNGYWTMTEYGNTWVSNYTWGWAPFHYGRWVHTAHRGWGWTPGYEWGPAWVDWRYGNGHYGWAPMQPNIGISVSIGLPINLWIFAPSRRIYDRNIYRYSYHNRPTIYNNTTIINNTYIVNNNHYYGGPSRRHIEHSTGRRVSVRNIRQSDRPGASSTDRRSVSIYRPDRDNNISSRNTSVIRGSENRTDRQTNSISSRSNNNKERTSRELYINKDGNSSIRNRENSSNVRSRTTRNEVKVGEIRNSKTKNSNEVERNDRSRIKENGHISRNSNISNEKQLEQSQVKTTHRETRIEQRKQSETTNSSPSRQYGRLTQSTERNTSRVNNPRVERNNSSSNNRSSNTATSKGNIERSSIRGMR